jgi:CRISPR subtype II RNA-guided endonuclease Cas9/Csn1
MILNYKKMNKFTLGLDIGTNSIGWVLFCDGKIIDSGVVYFPIGTNLKKGIQEESKNAQRRGYRGASRNQFRFKLRRKDLKKYLKSLDMLPDFNLLEKPKASELYQLRTDALQNRINKKELGRILILLNKHRGFKSNSKTLSVVNEEEGTVKEGINELKGFMLNNNAKTIGEYFHKMFLKSKELFEDGKWHNEDEPFDERAINENDGFSLKDSRGLRRENGRYVGREMYENEFDLIWEQQKAYYPELTGSKSEYDEICKLPIEEKLKQKHFFKQTLYWKIKHQTIFYQRPLKSQKKYIGKCTLESSKRTAPASSLIYQEFRIRKQLSDLRYTDIENDIYKASLSKEWKDKLFDYLQTNKNLGLGVARKNKEGETPTDIYDVLEITQKKNIIFIDEENEDGKSLNGNKTLYAIHKTVGHEKFIELKENNLLEKLWHILYMAKDDEWLTDTLVWKWEFSPEVTKDLVMMGLEEGFANYSSKALQKIVPYMQNGKDEFDAKLFAGYEKLKEEYTEKLPLKFKIKQLINNELRNPVVEKAVGETIRLVNDLLKHGGHDIDQENFTIRIESTREFKKPKKQREEIRRGNTDTDKRRIEYAKFLNKKREEGQLDFAREIQKGNPIIQKFELWLELGGDKDDSQFKEFEKIVKRKDREKHSLWLECNRICPYSGNVINLSTLFSSSTEIDHIIPYSKSLDDSFINKTITFTDWNKAKSDQILFDFIKSKGEQKFKEFKERTKIFSKEKKERLLLEKIDSGFINNQLPNTSYIAKYVKTKLQEICRDVQFSNGSATGELRKNDWKLNNLLEKVRYEELYGINIDDIIVEFNNYKRDFMAYRKRKANSTDIPPIDWKNLTLVITEEYEAETKNPIFEWWQELQKFNDFSYANGKKDRSDHRHHLLDAIIIALTSRSIIQKLSTFNASREKNGVSYYDEYGNITREKIDLPITLSEIKKALRDTLVYHKPEQKLLTSKINHIKVPKNDKGERTIKQKTFAPRGSLVGDNFYGKLKDPRHQGFDKDVVYVKRVDVNPDNFKDLKSLDKIVDTNIQQILELRLKKYDNKGDKAFSEEALEKDPLYMYSLKDYPNGLPNNPTSKEGNTLPVIKKIRVANKNARNLVPLHAVETHWQTKEKVIINENRYAETDGNYVMALYESREKDKKGKVTIKRDFELVSFFEAVKKRMSGEKLFPDIKEQKDGSELGLMDNCHHLKKDDFVIMYGKEEKKEDIKWDNDNELKKRLYKVTGLSSKIVKNKKANKEYEFGDIFFIKHNKSANNAKYESVNFEINKEVFFIQNSHAQLKCIKVKINRLGKIIQTANTIKELEIEESLSY